MKKHLSVRYGTIQGCYWMGYAALMGYASVYLTQIGRKARPYEQCSLERT